MENIQKGALWLRKTFSYPKMSKTKRGLLMKPKIQKSCTVPKKTQRGIKYGSFGLFGHPIPSRPLKSENSGPFRYLVVCLRKTNRSHVTSYNISRRLKMRPYPLTMLTTSKTTKQGWNSQPIFGSSKHRILIPS